MSVSLFHLVLPLWLLHSEFSASCDSKLTLWLKMQACLGGARLFGNLLVIIGVGLSMKPAFEILLLLWGLAQGAATESRTDTQRVRASLCTSFSPCEEKVWRVTSNHIETRIRFAHVSRTQASGRCFSALGIPRLPPRRVAASC